MALKTTVAMNAAGRLTVPKAARQALHLEGSTRLEVEVLDDALVLRPVPNGAAWEDEDAWARSPERQAAYARAMKDFEEGRVFQLNEAQLERFLAWADQRDREGHDEPLTYEKLVEFFAEPQE